MEETSNKNLNKPEMYDKNKIPYHYISSRNHVEYYIYKNEKNYTEHFTKENIENNNLGYIKNKSKYCFSQLPSMLHSFSIRYKEWPNRLLFMCDFKKHEKKEYHTTYEERCWWITICKKHKLLPNYINDPLAETGNLILKVNTLDLSTLYIYLSIVRYLQEEPYFIRAIKYLVVDKHMDFYIAFSVASRCCINNKGHHIIQIGKKYPSFDNHNNINLIDNYELNDIIRLKKFLDGGKFVDKIPIKDIKIGQSLGYFHLHEKLNKIPVKTTKINLKDLTSKEVVKEKIYMS